MRPSLDTAATTTYSTHPSLTSEASSIVSSEQPQTVSEHYRAHSPSHWRLPFSSTTTTEKDHNETPLTPRFARRLLKLVGSSHHQSTLATPSNLDELANYAAQGSQPIPRPHRKDHSREEAAASWGRASLASGASTTPLASKHSSLGPLPIFPRAPVRTLSRHSSLSSTLSQARQRREVEDDHQGTSKIGNSRSRIEPAVVNPATTPPPSRPSSRTAKLRPTLASLFQSAGRKALHRDEFRKDSYRKDNPPDDAAFVQSIPSTPFRRRFLGLMPDSIRSASRSATPSPAPPPTSALPAPPVPVPITVSSKGKESLIPPSPIIKRKRSSLPTPSRNPYDLHHDHGHSHEQPNHEMMNGHSLSYNDGNEGHFDSNNLYTVRRSRSDSKGKKAASQSHGTSVRVPAGPVQHHPHPHPYFPCDVPLDRGILSHGSFDFERPGTRPTTPRQSQEYLPIERTRRSRGRMEELDSGINSGMNPEIKSVIAAGTEARRERRAPSRERLRVIGPMQRSNLPDVTGGDNQFSPDPFPDNSFMPPPVPAIPGTPSLRPKTHMSHGMFSFESPASTPYGSRVELPAPPTPSKSRRETIPNPTPKGHHRQMSSSATAVSSPIPIISAKRDPYYEKDDRTSSRQSAREMGILKAFSLPKSSSIHSKPPPEKRVASPMSSADHYRRGSGSTMSHESGVPLSIPATYKLDLNTGRSRGPSPSSFRHNHFHSQSLSGSTAQSHYAPGQSPSTVGSILYPELSPPTREDRYHDLCQALRLSIGESRYKSFDRAVRRYKDRLIPLDGDRGVLVRVQQLLDGAVADGLVPVQTAGKYYQTFHSILVDE